MRRRAVLGVFACAAGLAGMARVRARPAVFVSESFALGTRVRLQIVAEDGLTARAQAAALLAELRRLEQIFSLYDPQSALARLNREGRLQAPPPELLEVLRLCAQLYAASEGRFDPTVQPLYALFAEHFSRLPTPPPQAAVEAARARIGFSRVRLAAECLALAPGAALTLNGIAQGAIADRLLECARRCGLEAACLDTGEIVALGRPPGKLAWDVVVQSGPLPKSLLPLRDRAVAVAHAGATHFDRAGLWTHILDPLSGRPAPPLRAAWVVAEKAALADGLATALCLLKPAQALALLRQFATEQAGLVDADGKVYHYRA